MAEYGSAQQAQHHRNVASSARKLHNALMSLGHPFSTFLQYVGAGVVIVLALLLVMRLGLPRRSAIDRASR